MGSSDITPAGEAEPSRLGDRIRAITQQLRQEEQVQIRATSRILGAAAQLAENNDRLVGEVVAMVEDDLAREAPPADCTTAYSVEALKQQFDSFKAAKAHFGLSARGWDGLVSKLNEQSPAPVSSPPLTQVSPQTLPQTLTADVAQRLAVVEEALQTMRADIQQLFHLLAQKDQ